jgi:hypothetical protein
MLLASVYVPALLVWRRKAELPIGETFHQKFGGGIEFTASSVTRFALVDRSLLKVDIAVFGLIGYGFPLQQFQLAATEDLASTYDLKKLCILEFGRCAASNWITLMRILIVLREFSIVQAPYTKG